MGNLDYKKNWAGKWTLLECCFFAKEYTSLLKKIYGVGPDHSLFTFEKGASSNFLVSSEVESFTCVLVEKVHADNTIVFDWVSRIVSAADALLAFVRSFEGKIATNKDFEKLWQLLDDYLIVHFPIKKIVDYLPKELLDAVLPHLEKARIYAEPVYAESLLFVQKFAADQAPQFNLTPELFLCMTDTELNFAFTNRVTPDKTILENRYNFSVLVFTNGMYNIIVSPEADELMKKVLHRDDKISSIKGMGAFPGKIQGRVQIVLDPSQYSSLQSGTVLVTGMTRPDYIHLFKDAVAVITDAGGILSHAAITAREMKKPTVVGTEVATKALKDGDIVEVDADRGIVTIIK